MCKLMGSDAEEPPVAKGKYRMCSDYVLVEMLLKATLLRKQATWEVLDSITLLWQWCFFVWVKRLAKIIWREYTGTAKSKPKPGKEGTAVGSMLKTWHGFIGRRQSSAKGVYYTVTFDRTIGNPKLPWKYPAVMINSVFTSHTGKWHN